ncbi:MAG: substrate-binding domain-containing protein [Rhizobiales bacterium]|nr:substrate-binding domain-containing protein [Hyphomicrobiales bacterium]
MLFSMGRLAAGFAVAVLSAHTANAAEIKVFSTVGVKSVLEEIVPKFEKATGNKVAITWSTAALLMKRVQAGEQADALILIKGNIETLQKEGKIVPGSDVIFSKSIFAVGIKAGAPKPDISTPEAFKKALLASKAVSYTNPATGGASGVYTAKQIDKMGIAEQMKGKSKHPPSGGFSGSLLVSGEADIAINSKPELMSDRHAHAAAHHVDRLLFRMLVRARAVALLPVHLHDLDRFTAHHRPARIGMLGRDQMILVGIERNASHANLQLALSHPDTIFIHAREHSIGLLKAFVQIARRQLQRFVEDFLRSNRQKRVARALRAADWRDRWRARYI